VINPLWSVVLTIVGATGIYLTGRKLWLGFAIGLFAQTLWVAYGFATGQWGFYGSAAIYGWVNYLGLRRWLRDKRQEKETTCPDPDPAASSSPSESTPRS